MNAEGRWDGAEVQVRALAWGSVEQVEELLSGLRRSGGHGNVTHIVCSDLVRIHKVSATFE